MMTLSINDEELQLDGSVTLNQLLEQRSPQGAFAVAVNGDFVPRSQYGETSLNDGDRVDIVSPVGGG